MLNDLSPPEHEHSAAIDQAAQFLAVTPPRERPVPLLPKLRAMFGLSAIECCEAIRESRVRAGGANAMPK